MISYFRRVAELSFFLLYLPYGLASDYIVCLNASHGLTSMSKVRFERVAYGLTSMGKVRFERFERVAWNGK